MNPVDTKDLLDRIRNKDVDAYAQFLSLHGGRVHTQLLRQMGDREAADTAFRRAASGFYRLLTREDSGEALALLLSIYAGSLTQFPAPVTPASECRGLPAPQDAPFARPPWSRLGLGFCAGLLSLGIAAALWVIAGLLMDMNLVPTLDLGYAWFDCHIFPWF